jgi:hypothetical protein
MQKRFDILDVDDIIPIGFENYFAWPANSSRFSLTFKMSGALSLKNNIT